jgi:hypothetical protein
MKKTVYSFIIAAVALVLAAGFYACDTGDLDNPFADATYTVTGAGSFEGGSITLSPTNAAAGTNVTIMVTPNAGYRLTEGSLKVNNGAVPVTGLANPYIFVMPADNVTVTATFELLPTNTYSVIVNNSLANGYITSDKEYAVAADTVTLTVSPDAGYRLAVDGLTVTQTGGTAVTVSGSGNTFTFTMPTAHVTVAAVFEALPAGEYSVVINPIIGGSISTDKMSAAAGVTVTLTITPQEGYEYTTSSLQVNGGAVTLSGSGPYTFAMPASNVTVTAQFTTINYNITTSGITNGTVTASVNGTTVTTVTAGTGVTLTAVPADGYELGSITVTKADNSAVPVNGEGPYTFTMPASNVTVVVEFTATITISGNLSHSPETIGGRTFSFTNLNATKISLHKFEEVDGVTVAASKVGTATITGNSYSISGVVAGTYRLTAEDPTGLYDYVNNHIVVEEESVTENITLAVFPGLKLTVRVPKTSTYTEAQYDFNANFILPVKSTNSQDFTNFSTNIGLPSALDIDLDVDWGDGSATSKINAGPTTHAADPNYTHSYTAALGSTDTRDFVIRMTGKAIATAMDSNGGKFPIGHYSSVPGTATTKGALPGILSYGNKDKIIKAAGNVTALTTGATLKKYAYSDMFFDCRNLEDISGLAFTDEGDWGIQFLASAFRACPKLKTAPATLLPPGLTATGSLLSRAFEQSGIETIGAGFVPAYTTIGASFLIAAFKECENLTAIPDDFFPASFSATVGNNFLAETFMDTKIAAVPANFVSHITTAGTYFLQNTFANTNVQTVPANFLPQSLGEAKNYFLTGTFAGTKITAVPGDFIPESYKNIKVGTNAFNGIFGNCSGLTTVNLDCFKYITVSATPNFSSMFFGCTNLATAYMNYFDIKLSSVAFASMFEGVADGFILDITGGMVEVEAKALHVYQSAGLTTEKVTAIYVDNDALVLAYQNSDRWEQVDDSKFQVRPVK